MSGPVGPHNHVEMMGNFVLGRSLCGHLYIQLHTYVYYSIMYFVYAHSRWIPYCNIQRVEYPPQQSVPTGTVSGPISLMSVHCRYSFYITTNPFSVVFP